MRHHEPELDITAWRERFAPSIVGDDDSLVTALETVQQVADTDCGVLITGESGTGKELFARAVHEASPRAGNAFVALNCAAIPESIIEGELFGHVKGAFTGATSARLGRIAAAQGGTLFLDEVGDMPLAAQAKLLRVLQDRTICPVGSDTDVQVDVRIVAATHRNLDEMVADGSFRADLFFRLCVIPVHIPALRERGNDVSVLANNMLTKINERTGRNVEGFDDGAVASMRAHKWPGNVRELGHAIERAILLKGKGQLSARDLRLPSVVADAPAALARGTGAMPVVDLEDEALDLRTALAHVERVLIDEALSRARGNRTEAAALLGLNRTTLVEKLRKYAG